MNTRPKHPPITKPCAFCGTPFTVTFKERERKFHSPKCFNAAKVTKHGSITPSAPRTPMIPIVLDPLDIPTPPPPGEDAVAFFLERMEARAARDAKKPLSFEECGLTPDQQIEPEPDPEPVYERVKGDVIFHFKAVPEDQIPATPSLRPLSDHPLEDKRWNGGGTQEGLRYHAKSMHQSGILPEAISQVLDVRIEDINKILASNTRSYEKKNRGSY